MGEAMAVATGVLQGTSAIMGGKASASAQRMKAAQMQIDAMAADTRATQLNSMYFEQVRSTFGTIDALNAGRGTNVNAGGTNVAMFNEAMRKSDRARETAVANQRAQGRRARSDSQITYDGADAYELAGLLKGAAGFASAAQAAFNMIPKPGAKS